jgi:hypothetical protein
MPGIRFAGKTGVKDKHGRKPSPGPKNPFAHCRIKKAAGCHCGIRPLTGKPTNILASELQLNGKNQKPIQPLMSEADYISAAIRKTLGGSFCPCLMKDAGRHYGVRRTQQPDLGITTERENQKPFRPSVACGELLILLSNGQPFV